MFDYDWLLLSFIAGAIFGSVFFVGLWWTVRRALLSPVPSLWFGISFVVRLMFLCSLFILIGGAHWQYFVAALCGLLAARTITLRILGRPTLHALRSGRGNKESHHAHQSR